jgi:acyl-CoA thioester hydrolase
VTPGFAIYRTQVLPEWVDYNGHLRDAYYVVVVSYAVDALMDHLGMDAPYRQRTQCTLYTLELHAHYFHEVKQPDMLEVSVRILAADAKRIHAAFGLSCARYAEPAASVEFMLLHVKQGASVASHAFPAEVVSAIETLQAATAGLTAATLGSRKMELRGR